MPDASDQHTLKWGDSFDLLSDERKRELRERLNAWNPEQATEDHPGPFAGERLNGLEVYWLAACALAGIDGDPMTAAGALTDPVRRIGVQLPSLNLSRADLTGSGLEGAYLREASLDGAIVTKATLYGAYLRDASLTKATLQEAYLLRADLRAADLRGAGLSTANLREANLRGANFSGADLSRCNLYESDLTGALLAGATLYEANFHEATLTEADLSNAILIGANLNEARLVRTTLSHADMTGCHVYGTSIWNVKLDDAIQKNLRITPDDEAEITTDNLEMTQFLYLLLANEKIRQVIDTITGKVVLILGRFTKPRKRVLDALRDELRQHNYVPVVFDFEKPTSRDLTETVSTLAHMARFVIADLTDPRSIPQEVTATIPHLPSVPVQPIIQADEAEYGMFEHWQRYQWVLEVYRYESLDTLLATLSDRAITPVEAKAAELQRQSTLPVDGL